jgi:hypothetical protein
VGLLHGLFCHLFALPTFYAQPLRLAGFRGLALMAVVILASYLCVHLRASLQRARFWASLAIFLAMGAAIIHVSDSPRIDVWLFQQIGGEALWKGYDPYSISYPDVYAATGETLKMYGTQLVHDGRVFVYPYPPLTALLSAPAWAVLGDVRWLALLSMGIAAWAIARLGGGATAELAALFLLFQGRSFLVLENAWTETLVLAAFAVATLVALRPAKRLPQWLALGLALGVLAASKQYSPLLLVPLALAVPRGSRARAAAIGLGVVALTALPFALWDAEALYRGVVQMQLVQPLRLDSLSLLALWARAFGRPAAGAVPAFAAAALVLFASLWRRPFSAVRAPAIAAAAWLVFVLLNKQAFCNYDWLGLGLSCVAVAALSKET